MGVIILNAEQARNYEPSDRTYAIRIFNSRKKIEIERARLKNSDFYIAIRNYTFDDISPNSGRGLSLVFNFFRYQLYNLEVIERVAFNANIASEMLSDFRIFGRDCSDVLVHCLKGRGRSPAVAMALNDIFGLGENSSELRRRFPYYNKLVYSIMMSAA